MFKGVAQEQRLSNCESLSCLLVQLINTIFCNLLLKLVSDVCLLQSGDQPTHEDLTAVANELLQLEDTIAKEDQ